MGLAASQARYLSLTARKTNVEYEGQQVNQERTALANQSAALYNQMLSLDVPTPPSATDFTRTVYTYVDPSEANSTITIDNIIKNPLEEGSNKQTYELYITRKETVNIANIVSFNDAEFDVDGKKALVYPYGKGGYSYTMTGPETAKGYIDSLNKSNRDAENNVTFGEDQKFYHYKDLSNGTYYYIPAQPGWKSTDAEGNETPWTAVELAQHLSDKSISLDSLSFYSVQSSVDETPDTISEAQMAVANDGTGRYSSITFMKDGKPMTLKLTQQTIQDEDAYDAAMETYEAKKAIYDKTVSEINAKTVVIQQQDKTLELHLDQLDTEQQAIQTELDAVKKVIDKNIDETFKIFA